MSNDKIWNRPSDFNCNVHVQEKVAEQYKSMQENLEQAVEPSMFAERKNPLKTFETTKYHI